MLVAQLTDTHVVRPGSTYFGVDTAAYLRDAIDALHALDPAPDVVVVTGDLTNFGEPAEYERFAELMAASRVPYFVVPGNHDDRDAMRACLPPRTYGGSNDARVRFAIDEYDVRVIGLDANGARPWPGARLDDASLRWLDRTLALRDATPALVCVHQPPFRTGLHYLDAFGFGGARRLRALLAPRARHVRVISGHIHCVRVGDVGGARASTAPSTAPQVVPELFERRPFALRRERPGFATHAWDAARGFVTTVFRRADDGRYVPVAESAAAAENAPA